MAYDGLVNFSIVNELKSKLINGKVDKIFEPNSEEILIGIYQHGVKYSLDLVINSRFYRVNLTTNSKPNPQQAPNFCMALRKYLLGTYITNIYTNNLERIINIEFEGYNKSKDFSTKKLIIELMGKHSNIILVDKDNKILDALKHFSIESGASRNIFSGVIYELPISNKLDFLTIKNTTEFYKVLKNNAILLQSDSLSYVISDTFTGISKNSIDSFESYLNITDSIAEDKSYLIFDYINKIICDTNHTHCENFKKNFSLRYDKSQEKSNLQINFFLDDYYTDKENISAFTTYRDNLLKLILNKISKLNLKLYNIQSKLIECKEAEKYKIYGELIISNLYRIPKSNTDSLTLENFYDNNLPINIPLDKSISPTANAKNFFKKYKKLQNAEEYINLQKNSIVNDIAYLESIVYEISIAKTLTDIDDIYSEIQSTSISLSNKKQKQNKKSISHKKALPIGEPLKYDIDGFTVLVGKNNKQNDYISTKLANSNDIWLHVKDFQGSHVILRTDGKTPTQDTLNKCAKLAKEHSKAKQSSNIPVDYTLVKYVKKPSGSRPGMVVYTHEKSVIVRLKNIFFDLSIKM